MTWRGGAVGGRAVAVLASNPGPMTLEGTNTWLLGEPGARRVVVVDPGPLDEGHLRAVLAAAAGREVAVVLLTHGHPDHADGAPRFAALSRAPVRAADVGFCVGAGPLVDGDALDVDGLRLEVLATPGHTADSVSLLAPDDGAVLTGDTVLGRGTSVVAHPDGRLGAYLDSLRRLRRVAGERGLRTVLPGHGPALADPVAVLDGYLAHRAERLEQVRAALASGASTPAEVVAVVYADLDPALRPAAELSVRAQLDHLHHPFG